MRRGTTPTLVLTVSNFDLTTAKSLYVTIAQFGNKLTKKSGDSSLKVEADTVSIWLTQEETLSFKSGSAEIQLRGISEGGEAFATEIAHIPVESILLEGVIQ